MIRIKEINNELFKLGKEVSYELGQSSLSPSKEELFKVAKKLNISIRKARQALDIFNWG